MKYSKQKRKGETIERGRGRENFSRKIFLLEENLSDKNLGSLFFFPYNTFIFSRYQQLTIGEIMTN